MAWPIIMQPSLNPNLKDFWEVQSRFKVLYGGRASSKSWDAAGHAIRLADNFKLQFLCARQYQNRIEDSVYNLLKAQIERFGLKGRFLVLKNKIHNLFTGSTFIFYGLWRNIDEIKSLEGIDVCWIEEAHNLKKEQLEILEPTIRKEGSEIWLTFNPRLASDYVFKEFVANKRKNSVVRQINYDKNPFLSSTILETINELKEKSPDDYNHIYLGQPLANDEAAVIQRKWIEAAIDAHKKIEVDGPNSIGFDVADGGADKNAKVKFLRGVATLAGEWKGGEDKILESCKVVYNDAIGDRLRICYDPVGVGAACGGKFAELNESTGQKIAYSKFLAGGGVESPGSVYANGMTNEKFFLNLKAQAWWKIADKFKNTYNKIVHGHDADPMDCISISSDIDCLEELIEQLSTPRRHFAENGKHKVESKADLEKRGVKSPNLADAFIMGAYMSQGGVGSFTDIMTQSFVDDEPIEGLRW